MQQNEVVLALKEMADLLEVAEANAFEVSAYRKASQALDDWEGDLSAIITSDEVGSIPSVGKGIGKVVADLVSYDASEEYDRIRSLVPEGLPRVLKVRGLGPKRVRTLWTELGVESIEDLEEAAKSGRMAKAKGFGAKTVERILASIEYLDRPLPTNDRSASDVTMPQAVAPTGRIVAGMSGYSYPEWKGSFYAKDAKTKDLLELYATKLATVEINNTFHRFPTEKVLQQWDAQTPERFQFSLKAHSRITHKLRLKPDSVRTILDFAERCGTLGSKLGCILFQFPPDFRRDDERLERLLESLPAGARYATEFRHASWLDEEVFKRLKSQNVALVCGESNGKDTVREITADFVYVRMRRDQYSKSELDDWQTWFGEQSQAKRDVYAYFKHDETGTAPVEVTRRWASQQKLAQSTTKQKKSTA